MIVGTHAESLDIAPDGTDANDGADPQSPASDATNLDANIEAAPSADAEPSEFPTGPAAESLPDESAVGTAGDPADSGPLYAANRPNSSSSSPQRGQSPRSYIDPAVQGMTSEQAKDYYDRWIGQRMKVYDANKEFLDKNPFQTWHKSTDADIPLSGDISRGERLPLPAHSILEVHILTLPRGVPSSRGRVINWNTILVDCAIDTARKRARQ
jgi:hypothetical protein